MASDHKDISVNLDKDAADKSAAPAKKSGLVTRTISGAVVGLGGLFLIYLGGWFFTGLLVLAFLIAVFEWNHIARAATSSVIILILGLVYLSLCFTAFYTLRQFHADGAWLALTVIIAIACGDSLAYFMGKAIGGPKLAPQISPKKTWAGLAGSVLGAGLVLLLMSNILPNYSSALASDYNVISQGAFGSFVLGCVLGVIGQIGDLLISYFKRRGGLKDAGHLIPGHGGLLDRIDSHLLAVLVFTLVHKVWLS